MPVFFMSITGFNFNIVDNSYIYVLNLGLIAFALVYAHSLIELEDEYHIFKSKDRFDAVFYPPFLISLISFFTTNWTIKYEIVKDKTIYLFCNPSLTLIVIIPL